MADDTTSPEAALIRARMAIDPRYAPALFQIESGGNPRAVTGSNRGLGQFGPREEAQYGITSANRMDPAAQTAAVQREAINHANVLTQRLGREPTPSELYFTHQQGIAGGPALLTADPSVPAWQVVRPYYSDALARSKGFASGDAMARAAITGNIPSKHPLAGTDPTAGDFRNLWMDRFNRALTGAGNAPAPASGTPAMPQPMGGAPVSPTAPSQAPAVPSQTGAVPVVPENAAPDNDALLKMLQAMSAPAQQQPAMPQMPPINFPQPKGLDLARAIARATGREKIA